MRNTGPDKLPSKGRKRFECFFRAIRYGNQERVDAHALRQRAKRVQRRDAGPVEIFENQQERTRLRERAEVMRERGEKTLLLAHRVELRAIR